jgi:hypothetical protein
MGVCRAAMDLGCLEGARCSEAAGGGGRRAPRRVRVPGVRRTGSARRLRVLARAASVGPTTTCCGCSPRSGRRSGSFSRASEWSTRFRRARRARPACSTRPRLHHHGRSKRCHRRIQSGGGEDLWLPFGRSDRTTLHRRPHSPGTSRSLPGADGAIPRVGTRHVHRPAARGRRHARGWHQVSG